MNVYVGTNTMKNAYIGKVLEYSLDLRNKTVSDLTALGWELISGSPTSSASGLYNTCKLRSSKLLEGKMTNAKKITFKLIGTPYQSNGISFGIAVEVPTTGVTNKTGNYMQANKEETNIYGTNYGDTSHSWSGEQTLTTIVDLDNKTWQTNISAGYNWNGTISASEVTGIRSNTTRMVLSQGGSCYVRYIQYIIDF